MRKTLIPIIVVAVLLFVALPQVFFVIDETELAIVTRFGAFQREYKEPGLKIKTPIVDNVTKFDKRLLRIGDNPDEINPNGGFLNYGLVGGTYALLHGSLPGPTTRLIRFRKAVRFHGKSTDAKVAPEITMVSQESQQGV